MNETTKQVAYEFVVSQQKQCFNEESQHSSTEKGYASYS